MTVFNKKKVNFTKEKLFFGEQLNTQRFDEFKYPIFDKLTQTQLGFFWRPEEVSLQKDRGDYQKLSESQKHICSRKSSCNCIPTLYIITRIRVMCHHMGFHGDHSFTKLHSHYKEHL